MQNALYSRDFTSTKVESTTYPRFFEEAVEDQLASARTGTKVFRMEERVEIIMPGNTQNRPVQIVTDEHKQRWPEAYGRFKAGKEVSPDGIPLEQWPVLNRAHVLTLKAQGFMTVEQVAGMSEHAIQGMMGGRRLKELAEGYLDDARAQALLTASTAANERKDAEIAALRHQVEELGKITQGMQSQLAVLQNAQHPLATALPHTFDPIERMKTNPAPVDEGGSSFDTLPAPRRRRTKSAEPDLAEQVAT